MRNIKNEFMKNFLKKYSGELLTIIGTGIFAYNVFNFSYKTRMGFSLSPLSNEPIQGVAYYYSNGTIVFITIGAILIVLGLIIMKRRVK